MNEKRLVYDDSNFENSNKKNKLTLSQKVEFTYFFNLNTYVGLIIILFKYIHEILIYL